jgi:hypothetical protein
VHAHEYTWESTQRGEAYWFYEFLHRSCFSCDFVFALVIRCLLSPISDAHADEYTWGSTRYGVVCQSRKHFLCFRPYAIFAFILARTWFPSEFLITTYETGASRPCNNGPD